MQETSEQYDAVIKICRDLFVNKMEDYGSAWRILRLPSLTDQIFIKAQRIRGLQQNEMQKVDEGEIPEFIGIINYSVMAMVQLEIGIAERPDISKEKALLLYDKIIAEAKDLMENKNHDYGEAWREMRIGSLTDLILQKLLRVKQIENNDGKTLASEGVGANYQDMINYAVFALILLKATKIQEEQVILVNEKDEQIGLMPKMEAHEKGKLHRAFSVFVYNDQGELMLQQRAFSKYHSPGLWTNTCCSHQRAGETNINAGKRRLQEEMGFVTELEDSISFIYKAPFDNGLTEHEFDHILVGKYNEKPNPNSAEVADWKWMKPEAVQKDILINPQNYTEWFKIIFEKYLVEMAKSEK